MATQLHHTLVAVALAAAAGAAFAQATSVLAPVTVTGRQEPPPLSIGGFGDIPLARTPLQASVVTLERMRDAGVQRLADLAHLDPAVGDAYNAEGYWDILSVRGFVIDNRFNYRRDGLPINAETSIPLDNKERLEVLKGLSGMQAGTSAPGGLVNVVVKRPLAVPLRSATLGWRESGSLLGAADVSQPLGDAAAVRLNAAYEHLDPVQRDASGYRYLLALAGAIRPTRSLLVEVEAETSRRSQPSVPGFSLLGSAVPSPSSIDPRINLNNQPWTQPVVLDGDNASLRVTQELGEQWRLVAHLGTQRLRSDDRTAFPFGCSAEDNFDRFCSDGTFDYYEFVSDGERRRTDALDLSLAGRFATAGLAHQLQTGVLRSKYSARFGPQIFDFAGIGNIDGTAIVGRSAGGLSESTDRDEYSTELYLRDSVQLSQQTSAWLGLRHTRLDRTATPQFAAPTRFSQSFTTPWIALSHEFAPGRMAYASWGEGVESDVAPNLPIYANAGQALPALKSRQWEIGLKATGDSFDWGAALFDIKRPLFADIGTCEDPASCTRQVDGTQRHRGMEATVAWRGSAWMIGAGAQWLRPRREGSIDPALNGLRPTNVAERSVTALAEYRLAALPGLALQGALAYESGRMALPDNSARTGGWTRLDAGARYEHRAGGSTLVWRLGVDNLTDRRAWKETPFQFSHSYLFPLPPRTWRLSVQADL
jgi:iron complex outermembrane receptor protein